MCLILSFFSICMEITRLYISFCFRSPSSTLDYWFVNHSTNGTVVSTLAHAPLTTYKLGTTYHEQQYHWLSERAEVVVFVKSPVALHVHEKRHSEYGEYKHDQKQQQAYVEQRRQWHGQGEQKGPDALRSLDQTQHTTHFGHTDHTQQCRRHEILGDQIAQHQTCDKNGFGSDKSRGSSRTGRSRVRTIFLRFGTKFMKSFV